MLPLAAFALGLWAFERAVAKQSLCWLIFGGMLWAICLISVARATA